MKSHAPFLNSLSRSQSYLEIGTRDGRTIAAVTAKRKTGVDPDASGRGVTHRMTSDLFFAANTERFDLVFIDGLHQREQVLRDVDHALACLLPGGIIVIHDCRPLEEYQQVRADRPPDGRPWTGDVWKAIVDLRQRPDVDTVVLDEDWGYGVVLPRPNRAMLLYADEHLTWEYYQEHRDILLRLVDRAGLDAFLKRAENDADSRPDQ